MNNDDSAVIGNVRTIAEHYEAVAAGKKRTIFCNVSDMAAALRTAADMLERVPRWIETCDCLPAASTTPAA
jgi:hypothetical protein